LIAAEKLSAEEVAAASTALSSFGFEFIDIVSEQVVAAYQVERDAWLRNRNATRLAKVQAVLTGAVGEPGEVEKALGFSLSRPFVGVVAWSDQDAGETDRLGRLEKQLAELAAALGAQPRAVLSVAPDDSTLWAWIPAASVDAAAVRSKLTASVRAAIGDPAAGLAGFRSTHQQARQAQALAVAAGEPQPLLASAELGPLALVATEVDGVRGWVQKVLGDLAADDENCARLRETEWAYLSSGSSLNTAAAELHVHKNTVQYRVGKAEEIRGRPLEDGRIDVEVALLACRLLGSTVLASPPT
jgi:DNA-binding PucR family transcriptional regulator